MNRFGILLVGICLSGLLLGAAAGMWVLKGNEAELERLGPLPAPESGSEEPLAPEFRKDGVVDDPAPDPEGAPAAGLYLERIRGR
jgi:hypothetical protein